MDRNSVIGIILISIVIGAWVLYQSSVNVRDVTPQQTKRTVERADSLRSAVKPAATAAPLQLEEPASAERTVVIETDLLRVNISSLGGTIRNWKLRKYHPWYGKDSATLVDLVHPGVKELGFSFRTNTGAKVDARALNFTLNAKEDVIRVAKGQTFTLQATATLQGGGQIVRSYTFDGSAYGVR
ncbi:MAG: membrane protein insertase YidC, partial [Candidatus Kapabacteria bacterium]|nr:membrane protein insertase YidC [Candidatus Kapabacteria bacterium]